MSNRDELSSKTKQALAIRAGYTCSFRGCQRPTSGPSEEAPDAVSVTGKAAHIHAAAPGGPRYLASMTPDERRNFSNGIWLCSHHADLIDNDKVTYAADELRAMKREHEDNCKRRHREGVRRGQPVNELIAIGPDIVFCGELIGADQSEWSFHLQDFVDGDLHALLTFIARYDTTPPMDRYVLVSGLGDGRVMSGAPAVKKRQSGRYELTFPVAMGAERIRAIDLAADLALSDKHDLMLTESGDIALVSGVDALPQKIETYLSSQKGESPFHKDFGTRIAEYFRLFAGSPWFEQFLKLEVIRQAAIPYIDPLYSRQYTPLSCIERVFGIELLADAPTNNWLPIRVDLEVKGLGRWQHQLSICVPKEEVKRPSWDELMAGPLRQVSQ
ncbi:hypothetical protein [Bradyrhizobium sp. CCGUVB23]|uniref:hypothetical protein n=1 Tax=Bradyrhizobium sp. CCGUVB23 TaxID=2949630 RepID=UPI0020B1AB72|nr:hypothetical protein [Bradyrhizobium sp. CCGUVB23]MCP3463093.1 hypothetical protein [Bradyrhizobium sp. CCGUVB23]